MKKLKSIFLKLFPKRNTYYAVVLFDGQQDYISGTPYPSKKEATKFCKKIKANTTTLKVTGIIKFHTTETLIRIENRFDKLKEEVDD
ncbi:hypothetical protein [Bacteroides neonati]|uniref:hypothetical protein n=1 Tax=Bacteroides neonati TaxID=1347393 RepID=UPI0004B08BB8|nr:hypothetical protein [Bacteroides neonati]